MSWLEWCSNELAWNNSILCREGLHQVSQSIKEIKALGWKDWWWFEVILGGDEFSPKLALWNYCRGCKTSRTFASKIEELSYARGGHTPSQTSWIT